MDDNRWKNGRWTAKAGGFHVLAAGFGDAPPVVAAALDAVDHFPKFPANVAEP
ncbi:hypothetical protein D3C83_266950 [compost metagenome]